VFGKWIFKHKFKVDDSHTRLVGSSGVLGTELSLSSRGRMTLGVEAIFWFISLYHNAMPSKGLGIHTYRLLASQEYDRC
jgi:hypothetical protein